MELCRVITVSDRAARGARGPLRTSSGRRSSGCWGYETSLLVVPDDGDVSVRAALNEALAVGSRLIVTTGGTGVGPRDRTPAGTRQVTDRQLGVELLRGDVRWQSIHAALGRGVVGDIDASASSPGALINKLPGGAKAAQEGIAVTLLLIPQAIDRLAGGDH